MEREVKPEPVPPAKLWRMRKPWRPVQQFSASYLTQSWTRSMIFLPLGGVIVAGDHLLGVEELAVGVRADLVDDGDLQV
jgi:hypothetical protein